MTKSVLIVGAGVLGQATGKGLIARGFEVAFADVDAAVVRRLRLEGYSAKEVREIETPAADVYMLAVPTYTLDRKNDGIGCIVSASAHVGTWLSRQSGYGLVVVRSTVLPGTTEETVLPILEETSGKQAGRDFGVCVNPEYLRERRAEEDFANPWLTLIGEYDQRSGDVLQEIMSWAKCPLHRASLREAEMQKFVHNLCNASKISFFNEMREVCRAEGLNSERVLALVSQSAEAVWNPRYGTRDLGPFGGSCLPKDSRAFLSWAQMRLLDTPMLEATIKLNEDLQVRQRVDSTPVRLRAPSREG